MAGLASILFEMLDRFFALRLLGSSLRPLVGNEPLDGECEPFLTGPGVVEPEGVLSGPSLGVLRDVRPSIESRLGSIGIPTMEAASGSDKGGSIGSRGPIEIRLGEIAIAPRGEFLKRIREAGVAGPPRPGLARRAGE